MKLLLTGATGFVGTNFILNLYQKYQITALIREQSNVSKISPFCSLFVYKNDINSLIDFCKKECFDGVVHLATHYQPSHQSDEIQNILDSNIYFGVNLLEALKTTPPKFFINTLTFSQFSNGVSFSPSSLYDSTKQAFFDFIAFYSTQMKTNFAHLLLYNTFGTNDPRKKIFNLWKDNLNSNTPLEMSLGEQKIDISHIDDVIEGFDHLIQMSIKKHIPNNTIYTLQNQRYTLRELATVFEQVCNQKLHILWGAKPYRDNEIMNPIQSPQIPILPHWQPKISLQEGIKKLITKNSEGGGV